MTDNKQKMRVTLFRDAKLIEFCQQKRLLTYKKAAFFTKMPA